ncbi:polyprenyl synthetase family protein [Kineobactrum salinum]|uniref:Polyprenyl synthetase family protein n=1 Tax=Kineobactrum salinum TaxID=2708301 RepID=A0A6C0U6U4_9GAMM|nr:farnesyl diphosphate synthase [Kineobactrum salinum]QIB66155.1 polyprenyl synthetase family protein [Kineobactrum salinum]
MSEELAGFLRLCVDRCQASLNQLASPGPGTILELDDSLGGLAVAVDYALSGGGKRIRPCLVYAAAQAIDGSAPNPLLDIPATAIELIHNYSLIHDDLPAMDDDDLRRGKATLHKAFDEPTAILVGDGLQALAFELLATAQDLSAEQKVSMIKELAKASGLAGMVGGQYLDVCATGRPLTLEQLQAMHERKTGALIRAALALGGIAAGASSDQLAALDGCGRHIGLAFQIVDDILDVEGDTQTLGKTQGKDALDDKATYVKLLGLASARESAEHLLDGALDALEDFGKSADMLRGLARLVVDRKA